MAAPLRTIEGIEGTITKVRPERIVPAILLVGMVVAAGYGSFLVFKPFLAGLAWASVLAIGIQPVFRRLRKRLRASRAALATTAAVAAAFIGPACFLVVRLAAECINLASRLAATDNGTQIMHSLEKHWLGLQSRFPSLRGIDPIEHLNAAILRIGKELALAGSALAQNALEFIGLLVVVLLALFFLLRDGPRLVDWLRRLSPLEADVTDRFFEEIRALIESSVAATLLIASVQGALGAIATAALGLPGPLIWGVAFGFCSLLPIIGTALVWIPAVLILVVSGQHGKAVAMLVVSVVVIGQADNVLRPVLVSGRSRLSLQMSVLSVLGGVAAFGMLGLVLGPVVVAASTALAEIYLDSQSQRGASSGFSASGGPT